MARFFSQHKHSQRGSLLIEIVLVTFLFAVLSVGLVSTVITSTTASKQGTGYVVATGYIKEGIEAVRSIRDQDWSGVTNGSHGLTTGSSYYEFSGTSDSLDGGVYTRTITIEDVYRTGGPTGDIAPTGVLDSSSKKVTVNVVWDVLDGHTQNIDAVFYVFNLDALQSWVQSLQADFQAGITNSTTVTATGDGEVQLSVHNADWSDAETIYEVDLTGTGNRNVAYYDEVNDILYTLAFNTAGDDFQKFDTSDVDSAAPVLLDGYDIQNALDFVISDGYAYIVTTDDSVEVDIVDVSTMSRLTSLDLPNTADATSVDITGTTMVVTRESSGEDELLIYDISTPSSPSLEYSTNVSASIIDVVVNSTHAFGSSANNSEEVFAFQLSDGAQVDTLDLTNSDNAGQMHIVGSNLYVGRTNGSSYDLVLVDVSDPGGAGMSIDDTLEIATDVNDIDVDSSEEYLFIASNGGSQEVIVVDLDTFTVVNYGDATGTNDAHAVEVYGGYIYIGSTANANELMVLEIVESGWVSPLLAGSANKSGSRNAFNVYVDGNYTYLVTDGNASDSELYIYDTTTPSSPTYLSKFEIGADANDVVASGNYVYIATDHNSRELDIIDVTTKTSPTRIGSYNAPGGKNAETVELSGTTAFLGRASSSNDEFVVIHTLNPGGWENPQLEGSADKSGSHNIREIYVSGSYAYLVTDSSSDELYIYNISTPGSPSLEGSFNVGATVRDVYVSGNYAYLATHSNSRELDVIDVTTKSSPSRAGSLNLSGNRNAFSVTGSGSKVYIGRDRSGKNDELYVIDVSTPSSPSLDGSDNLNGDINKVAVSGSYVYAASDDNSYELAVFDVSTPSSPTLAGGLNLTGSANAEAVDVDGTTVVIGRASSGQPELAVIDIASPTSPSLLGTGEVGSIVRDVALSGTDLFVASDLNNKEMQYWDISTPASPSWDGEYDLNADANGVFFDGTCAYMGTEHNSLELQIISEGAAATVPDDPTLAGSVDAGAMIYELAVSGSYVYAATGHNSQELQVYDVSTPTSPSLATSYDASGPADARGIDTYGTTAVFVRASSGNDEVYVMDITTPTSPSYQGSEDSGGTLNDVSMNDADAAFVGSDENNYEFQYWDISAPATPSQKGTYDTDADVNGIFYNGTNVFLATEHNSLELQILEAGAGPSDYTPEGSFTSQTYDAGSAATWSLISWTESGTGDIEFRIRTADTEGNLSSANWVGSDGTSATTYSTSGSTITVDPGASRTQWIQWKAYLTGNSTTTPVLEDITLQYTP